MSYISERIKYFRNLRGITQKQLGVAVGFPEKTADIRIAQYESGTRTPKNDLVTRLAEVLDVSSGALCVPNVDDEDGVNRLLLVLEDLYGLKIVAHNGEIFLKFDVSISTTTNSQKINEFLIEWNNQKEKLKLGLLTKEDYEQWKYNYRGDK